MSDRQPLCGITTAAFRIHRYEPDREGVGDLDVPRSQLYVVHNRTPWQIRVEEHECGDFQVAPLGERLISGERLQMFEEALIPLRQRHFLRVRPQVHSPRGVRWPWMLIVLASLATFITLSYTFIVDGTLKRLECGVATGVFVIALVIGLVAAWRSESHRVKLEEYADREEGDSVFGSGGAYYSGNETERKAWQTLALVIVLVAAVVLPALAIFFGTDLQDLVSLEGGLSVTSNSGRRRVVARLIQIIYVALLTLFPALMYFQFDRVRVGTLRGQWVRNIFRLDGRMKNLADVQASYGSQLGEASGFSTDTVRLLGGKRSPIVVATIFLAIGWTLLVLPTRSRDFQSALSAEVALEEAQDQLAVAQNERDTVVAGTDDGADGQAEATPEVQAAAQAAQAAGRQAEAAAEEAAGLAEAGSATTSAPTTTTAGARSGSSTTAATSLTNDARVELAETAVSNASLEVDDAQARLIKAQGGDFFQLVTPRPSAAAMAFLGAYFFAVYLVLRGYLRGDLRPKVYNQITARLVTVVVLSYLFNVLYLVNGARTSVDKAILTTAFVAGIVPQTFLRGLGEKMRTGQHSSKLFSQAFAEQRLLTTIDGIDIYERERLASEGINDIEALAHADVIGLMVDTRLPLERIVDWMDQAVLQLHVNPPTLESGERSAELQALHELGIRTGSDILRVENAFRGSLSTAQTERTRVLEAVGGESRFDLLVGQICAEPATAVIRQWNGSEFADPRWPYHYLDRWGDLQQHPAALEPYVPPCLGVCGPAPSGADAQVLDLAQAATDEPEPAAAEADADEAEVVALPTAVGGASGGNGHSSAPDTEEVGGASEI